MEYLLFHASTFDREYNIYHMIDEEKTACGMLVRHYKTTKVKNPIDLVVCKNCEIRSNNKTPRRRKEEAKEARIREDERLKHLCKITPENNDKIVLHDQVKYILPGAPLMIVVGFRFLDDEWFAFCEYFNKGILVSELISVELLNIYKKGDT